MIRVEFEGSSGDDDFIRGLLEEIKDDLQDALEDVRCPDHGEEADVVIRVTEDDEVQVHLGTCCDRFREMVDAVLRNADEEDPDDT